MFTLLADGREEAVPGLTVPAGEKVLGWERTPAGRPSWRRTTSPSAAG
nr:hypothetical protein [Microtetraspora fusca]